MEPITIGILCAIGGALLGGGGVYVVEENDKEKLRKKNRELQAAVERLGKEQESLRRSAEAGTLRELGLCLSAFSQKLENIQALGRVNLADYVHTTAVVGEIEELAKKLHARVAWTPEERRFVALVAASLDLSKSPAEADSAWLSEFVFDRNGKSIAAMVRGLLSRRARQAAADLRALKEESWGAEHQRDLLTRKEGVEGLNEFERTELGSAVGRLKRYPRRLREQERLLETIKVLLVVVSRLDRPASGLDDGDRAVERVLQRLVRGDQMTVGDQKLLLLYSKKHFGDVRPRVEKETGISLLTWDTRESSPAT